MNRNITVTRRFIIESIYMRTKVTTMIITIGAKNDKMIEITTMKAMIIMKDPFKIIGLSIDNTTRNPTQDSLIPTRLSMQLPIISIRTSHRLPRTIPKAPNPTRES